MKNAVQILELAEELTRVRVPYAKVLLALYEEAVQDAVFCLEMEGYAIPEQLANYKPE